MPRWTSENSKKTPKGYHHKCVDCGVEWFTKHDTNAQRCRPCQGIQQSKVLIKPESEKTKHKRVCSKCERVDYLLQHPRHRKTTLCCLCSRQANGKANATKKRKPSTKPRVKKVKPVVVKPKKISVKFENDKRVLLRAEKERERNRAHREHVEAQKKTRAPELTPEQEKAMIDAYYDSNEVTHRDCKEMYGATTLKMNIGGY